MSANGPSRRVPALTDRQVRRTASDLWFNELAGFPSVRPSEAFPDFTWSDARAVAREVDRLRADAGHTRVGYRLGWTSEVVRTALGIDGPNWGTLWDHRRIDDGLFSGRDLWHPKVEPALVWRCGSDLEGIGVDADAVRDTAAGWALGLEILHPRFIDFEFTWLDDTADNSATQAFCIGEFRDLEDDPATLTVRFGNGREVRDGGGAAAMGSPAEAVAWLVCALAAEGDGLSEGDLVFTGGLAPPFDVHQGDRFRVEAAEFDPVGIDVADDGGRTRLKPDPDDGPPDG